jgi:hypothetical protein
MNERIAALAKLAVLLGTPIATWPKAPTTEITISGGGLGRVVGLTLLHAGSRSTLQI